MTTPSSLYDRLEAWVHRQHPIVSSLSHGAIVAAQITFGLLLQWISSLVEPGQPIQFVTFFTGLGIGEYLLRELEQGRAAAKLGDSRKLDDSVKDFVVPLVVAIALGVWYNGLV